VQIFRGLTVIKVGIFLALLFGAVTLLALGFQLGDYQNPDLAKVCYALAGIILVGAFVALFWPSKSGSAQELETQERRRRQDALDAYFNRMQQWLSDEDRPLATLPHNEQRRMMARTRTLEVLRNQDPDGKRSVVRFLYEHELITKEQPVISLHGADVSGANLVDMDLRNINLSNVNLSGADMSRAKLMSLHVSSAAWVRAGEREGVWDDLGQPDESSDLSSANLSRAILWHTHLTGCNLIFADFADAKLDGTDLRAADLREALNLTQEQINQAYGSSGQQQYMLDTQLPDHLEAPEAWNNLLSQQRRERGDL
jgi:uncharacterized protein YjbI with pentapeptide repeats